jgi:hypothetical protein
VGASRRPWAQDSPRLHQWRPLQRLAGCPSHLCFRPLCQQLSAPRFLAGANLQSPISGGGGGKGEPVGEAGVPRGLKFLPWGLNPFSFLPHQQPCPALRCPTHPQTQLCLSVSPPGATAWPPAPTYHPVVKGADRTEMRALIRGGGCRPSWKAEAACLVAVTAGAACPSPCLSPAGAG